MNDSVQLEKTFIWIGTSGQTAIYHLLGWFDPWKKILPQKRSYFLHNWKSQASLAWTDHCRSVSLHSGVFLTNLISWKLVTTLTQVSPVAWSVQLLLNYSPCGYTAHLILMLCKEYLPHVALRFGTSDNKIFMEKTVVVSAVSTCPSYEGESRCPESPRRSVQSIPAWTWACAAFLSS